METKNTLIVFSVLIFVGLISALVIKNTTYQTRVTYVDSKWELVDGKPTLIEKNVIIVNPSLYKAFTISKPSHYLPGVLVATGGLILFLLCLLFDFRGFGRDWKIPPYVYAIIPFVIGLSILINSIGDLQDHTSKEMYEDYLNEQVKNLSKKDATKLVNSWF